MEQQPLLDHIDVGVLVLDLNYRVQVWNRFMAIRSGVAASEIIGHALFDHFPDLPRAWLIRKLESVIRLKNHAFSSWEHRPYLFRMAHDRPITGGIDCMRQNLTLVPVKDAQDEVVAVSITLHDVTDVCIYQTRLNEANQRLEILSQLDGLTGLYNRRHWQERMDEEFERAQRYGTLFCLLLFDLDHFKKINDGYGHLGGDEVLKAVASRLRSLLRSNDLAGRYGGEEFAVLLPSTSIEGARVVANKVHQVMRSTAVPFAGGEIAFTVSMGLAQFEPDCSSVAALIARADEALYAAKHSGRDRILAYGESVIESQAVSVASRRC